MRLQFHLAAVLVATAGLVASAVIPSVPDSTAVSLVETSNTHPLPHANEGEPSKIVHLVRRNDPHPNSLSRSDNEKLRRSHNQEANRQDARVKTETDEAKRHEALADKSKEAITKYHQETAAGTRIHSPSILTNYQNEHNQHKANAEQSWSNAAEAQKAGRYHTEMFKAHNHGANGNKVEAAKAFDTAKAIHDAPAVPIHRE
ncbi:hypothetical protein FRC19_011662 [Serendipita sp. 401]|nr:hypothetical protein FRC19_011662 [Serendipita sp. 401]KAG9047393.1 hypothetical protein FS842_000665 [Serendipita sp. 407]